MKQRWYTKVCQGHSLARAPLVHDGTVYYVEQDEEGDAPIVAADLATGKVRWRVSRKVYGAQEKKKALFMASLAGSLAIAGDQLIVPTTGSTLGLARKTGAIAWRAEKQPSYAGLTNATTLVVHGKNVWRTLGNSLLKVSIGSGAVRAFVHGTKAAKLGDGLVGTATHLVVQSTTRMVGFAIAKPDKAAWASSDAEFVSGVYSARPVLATVPGDDDDDGADVVLFATSKSRQLRAVIVATGKERWSVAVDALPQYAVGDDRVVVASRSGSLVAYELATGTKVWAVKAKSGDDTGKLAVGEGKVFAVLPDGKTLAVRDLATGKLLETLAAPKGDPFAGFAPPVVADGTLVVHTRAGITAWS